MLRGLDRIVADWSREGVKLHAESIAAQASHWARLLPLLVVPLWLARIGAGGARAGGNFPVRRRAGPAPPCDRDAAGRGGGNRDPRLSENGRRYRA